MKGISNEASNFKNNILLVFELCPEAHTIH